MPAQLLRSRGLLKEDEDVNEDSLLAEGDDEGPILRGGLNPMDH
jgi:hypothetical protein